MGEWLSNNKKTITSTLIVVAIIILAFGLVYTCINGSLQEFISEFSEIVAPITIGFVIAYLSNPAITFLERRVFKWIKSFSLRRLISIILIFALAICLIVCIITMLIPNLVATLRSFWDTYIVNYESAATLFAARVNLLMDEFSIFDSTQRLDPQAFVETIRANFPWLDNIVEGDFSDILQDSMMDSAENNTAAFDITKLLASDGFVSLMGYIMSFGSSIFNLVKNILLGIFVAIYMLISKEKFKAYFRRFLNSFLAPSQVRYIIRFGTLLDRSFGGFIEGQLLDALIVGIITYILFNAFSFANPLLLATIIAVTNVIPILGPFIGGIPAAFLVLLTQPEKVILFVVLILVVQQIDGNIICPNIIGDKINISSLATLIAIITMGGLFGIFGMVIGVPVFAVILHLINNYTINSLRRKGFETSLEHYHVGDPSCIVEKKSQIDFTRILKSISAATQKLMTNKKSKKNNKEK